MQNTNETILNMFEEIQRSYMKQNLTIPDIKTP